MLGEGELGEGGCAMFLSEPRFDRLPCVIETGRDDGRRHGAEDVALAFKLRKRGKASRAQQTIGCRRQRQRVQVEQRVSRHEQ